MGVAGTRDVTDNAQNTGAGADGTSGSEDADNDGLSDPPDDADTARIVFVQDAGRVAAKFAEHWEILHELVHGYSELIPRVEGTTKSVSQDQYDFNCHIRCFPQPAGRAPGHHTNERQPVEHGEQPDPDASAPQPPAQLPPRDGCLGHPIGVLAGCQLRCVVRGVEERLREHRPKSRARVSRPGNFTTVVNINPSEWLIR